MDAITFLQRKCTVGLISTFAVNHKRHGNSPLTVGGSEFQVSRVQI